MHSKSDTDVQRQETSDSTAQDEIGTYLIGEVAKMIGSTVKTIFPIIGHGPYFVRACRHLEGEYRKQERQSHGYERVNHCRYYNRMIFNRYAFFFTSFDLKIDLTAKIMTGINVIT